MKNIKIEVGKKIKITPLGSSRQKVGAEGKKKNPIFKGKVVELYKHFFIVDNGIWKESFRYTDIGISGGIHVVIS